MRALLLPLALIATVRAAQPTAPQPKAAPIRPLPWGQLNFLHTTDVHGWFGGHLQEASFSADWGDYVSFAHHLRQRADAEGVDILLVDTGDRVEGNGLYDSSEPKNKYIFEILKQQHIDVISSGNHELYKSNSSYDEYRINVPNFQGNYLASNLDIYDNTTDKYVPLAPRYKKFTTKNQGIRIITFGFIFDFDMNSNATRVQRVEDTIKEQWFIDAISARDVDLFLVTGHATVRSQESKILYETIRKQQWDTPIAFLGGHEHTRDFKEWDKMAVGLASGRYLETVGFMSINGLSTAKKAVDTRKVAFNRLYIDNNLFSLHHHSRQNDSTFSTEHGRNVSAMITKARTELRLDYAFGCAPKDYWINRAVIDSQDSIFRLLGEHIIPDTLAENKKGVAPKIIISNTGALRFDIFKGPFTIDTTYLISPFTSGFEVIRGVPASIAVKILQVLNTQTKILDTSSPIIDMSELASPEQRSIRARPPPPSTDIRLDTSIQHPLSSEDKPNTLLPGYTTHDDYGTTGDDTVHLPIEFFNVPNCFQTLVDFPSDPDEVVDRIDVVYNAFISPYILWALDFLGSTRYKNETEPYMYGKSLTSLISDWVGRNWPCDKEEDL